MRRLRLTHIPLSLTRKGHNLYKGKWIVENSLANDEVVNVTTPALSVSETELHEDLNVEIKLKRP